MAVIVPEVAARKRTPSSTALGSLAERLAGVVSGLQRLAARASAPASRLQAAARVAARRDSPAALRFMWLCGSWGTAALVFATEALREGSVLAFSYTDCIREAD